MGTLLSASRRASLSRSLFALSFLAAFSNAACESRVSLGAACSVSSDCPSPYVCLSGRCRSECNEARDCPFPLECMLFGGVGGCRVTEDGVCPRGSVDCAPGLECVSGRCAQPCADHDECAAAQTCATSTVCERAPTMEVCDPLGGSCAAGQTCTDMGCVMLGLPAPGATAELHSPCVDDEDCRDGLVCGGGRCMRRCRRAGDGTPLSSCGTNSFCTGSDTVGAQRPPEGFGYCTEPCDPTASGVAAGCNDGLNCGVSIPSRNVYGVCEPAASDGGARWGPCNNQQCATGLDCVAGVYATGVCLAWCEGDEDCIGGREICDLSRAHTVVDDRGVTRRVGVCTPDCELPEECTDLFALPSPVTCTGGVCVRG
jgi:hypothetical protein